MLKNYANQFANIVLDKSRNIIYIPTCFGDVIDASVGTRPFSALVVVVKKITRVLTETT